MAVRTPLLLLAPTGEPQLQFFEFTSADMGYLHEFAPYAYGNNSLGPSAKLEVNTANGTLMSGQPFVDTYYIAGTYTTRVDRFSTEAETPNISMVTDNYNRIRVVYDSVSLPTGDTNNLQYPLYLWNDGTTTQLRAMSNQDFIDTFVTPALAVLDVWSASTTNQQQGTYFLTTSSNPSNATLVSSTPVAVNSVANIAAYSAAGIPEAQKQTTDTNYYLAQVNYAPSSYNVYDPGLGTYYLPLYFDAGTEQIRQHTPTTWANLLGPFLRYYLAASGTGYQINYNLSSGNQRGSTYTDTRVVPTGTGYTTLYVNTDDYRTQEFPTGTATTITANTKRFYINRNSPTYSASANPSLGVDEGQSVTFTLNTTNVLDGTTFEYAITGINAADITSGSLSGNVTISGGQGSTTITFALDFVTENEMAICSFATPSGIRTASVSVIDVSEVVSLEGTAAVPETNGAPPLSDGSVSVGWAFIGNGAISNAGQVQDFNVDRTPQYTSTGHAVWHTPTTTTQYYFRFSIYDQSDPGSQTFSAAPTLNTWVAMPTGTSLQPFVTDNRTANSYGAAHVTWKVEIATDSGGTNIIATGYYRSNYEGGA